VGVVLAKGFWSTFFCWAFPPLAFWLVAEKLASLLVAFVR